MPVTDYLRQELVKLSRDEYLKLLKEVDTERLSGHESDWESPVPGMSEEEFAFWIAARHYYIDQGIRRIHYLPRNAPRGEVRLLEVNELAAPPETGPVIAVDFLPDVEGIDYSLYVADVSSSQFDLIQKGELALPTGWDFAGSIEIPPR